MEGANVPLLFGVAIVILYCWSTINILREYERGVVFRLGR
jgi:regulator of protease activity HflC (stomatin/prohibitin superfamily)